VPNVFKVAVVQYWLRDCWIDPQGQPCGKDPPGARFVKSRKVMAGTPGAKKVKKKSSKWYGRVPGSPRPVPLSTNKTAAQQMLAELVRKAELGRVGIVDPFEAHRKRPLAEHLQDYRRELEARGNAPRYVALVVSRLEALLDGCGFRLIPDLSASRVTDWLADLRQKGGARATLEPGKEWFTRNEVAGLLSIKPFSVPPLVRRHRLAARGNGKARRYPRATVEALQDLQAPGASTATTNQYLTHLKAFCRWLVKDRRTGDNPVAHLEPGNEAVDRRHDRRELEAEELRRVLTAARDSGRTFRGLDGRDRFHLYAAACATGFRASGLASLTPGSFDLDTEPPTVTLAARHNKSRVLKVQPLPPDVADLLRDYLAGKPAGRPIWEGTGTWARDRVAADMLRLDLEAAGIPYAVEGPDGPLFADFHALRHTYLTLVGRAGIDLRTLQESAGHSTPTLTARYSHRRLHDLAGAVERLPDFLPGDAPPEALQATGTDPTPAPVCTGFVQTADIGRERLRLIETPEGGEGEKQAGPNPLSPQGVEASCDRLRSVDSKAGDGIRTHDVQLGKRNTPSAEMHRNPCHFNILRGMGPICKHMRAVFATCEKLRHFRGFRIPAAAVRQFCGRTAEALVRGNTPRRPEAVRGPRRCDVSADGPRPRPGGRRRASA
jgi:integrase